MKKQTRKYVSHALNIVTIALIVECFLCSMLMVRKFAKEHCMDRIQETAKQAGTMFTHALDQRWEKLTVFADILAANNENPEPLLLTYMETFCKTQDFSAVCIHRANGTTVSYGEHPHDVTKSGTFEEEVGKLPYISKVFSTGDAPEENFLFQAVPIVRNGTTVAVLYGYMSLDVMPSFIASSAYNGNCQFYVVDGDTGDFLMDEYHGTLANLYDSSMDQQETKRGYSQETMRQGIRNGESGFLILRPQRTGEWYYTYYMPLGIRNWSIQLTIDETTAFQAYRSISVTILVLMFCVLGLMAIHVLALMQQTRLMNRWDQQRLHKADFINTVQRTLLIAHNNPDFVDQALKVVAQEMGAETVLLLTFADKMVRNASYWPSKDKAQAMSLVGRNIREDFPMLYDLLASQSSVVYDGKDGRMDISQTASAFFASVDIHRLVLSPIMDTAGKLKGALAAVNTADGKGPEVLESVTYDFFMAAANLENYAIIKNMGLMDFLTGVKNRNSYESELSSYSMLDADSLWCIFVDVNGLRELNNSKGHKAGDLMLCTVADILKRTFGENFTYRIGGDEFVAFVPDSGPDAMEERKQALTAELAAKGYSVSAGYSGARREAGKLLRIDRIIEEAEEIMYREKWEYYQRNGIPSDRGHFPFLQK